MDKIKLFTFLGVCLFVNISCNQSETSSKEIKHPQTQYIPGGEEKVTISASQGVKSKIALKKYSTRLSTKEKILQIGTRQGPENKMFGRIGGIVTDKKGYIYILDSRSSKIKVFNDEGNFKFSIGRGGKGPGEFQSPTDIDMDQNGNIYVSDRSNAVHVFQQAQEKYEYDTTINLHYAPDSFCIIEDHMYVRAIGLNRNKEEAEFKTIHKYDLANGKYLESFGQPYQSPNTFVKKQLSDGVIACNEKNKSVISTFDGMPYLFAYDGNGNLNWKAKIKSFSTRPIIEKNDGGSPSVTLKGTDYPVDAVESLTPIKGSDLFFTQLIRRPAKKGAPMSDISVRTFLISAKDGSSSSLGEQINPINAATSNRILTNAILDSLYPNVISYSY